MENSKINWTDHTFNSWIGCTQVDHECKHCYAMVQQDQRYGSKRKKRWGPTAERQKTSAANWKKPRQWNKQAEEAGETHFVFCGSLMDVADDHISIKQEWRDDLIKLIRDTPNLTWLLLSKRPENYTKYLPPEPLPNVWLGTSAGHGDPKAIARIKALQQCEVAKGCQRFISAEPLLEKAAPSGGILPLIAEGGTLDLKGVGWLIVGGESGAGARAFDLANAHRVYEECKRQQVSFWFKQVGEITVNGSAKVETHGEIHNLSCVPTEYEAMLVHDRPSGVKVACTKSVHAAKPTVATEEVATIDPKLAEEYSADLTVKLDYFVKAQMPTREVREREQALRPQLLEALSSFRRSRFELGRLLNLYRAMFDGSFKSLCASLGLPRQCGYDLIADYEKANKLPAPVRHAALMQGYDVAERKNHALVDSLAKANSLKSCEEKTPEDVNTIVAEVVKHFKAAKAKPTCELLQIAPATEKTSATVPSQALTPPMAPTLVKRSTTAQSATEDLGEMLKAFVSAAITHMTKEEAMLALSNAWDARASMVQAA